MQRMLHSSLQEVVIRMRDYEGKHMHNIIHVLDTQAKLKRGTLKVQNGLATISTFSAPQPAAKCNICSARHLVQSIHKNGNLKRCGRRTNCVAPKSKEKAAACSERETGASLASFKELHPLG